MRTAHDKDIKNKEAELATLRGKLKVLEQSSGAGAKRIADLKQEYEETVKSKIFIRLTKTLFVEYLIERITCIFRVRTFASSRKGRIR